MLRSAFLSPVAAGHAVGGIAQTPADQSVVCIERATDLRCADDLFPPRAPIMPRKFQQPLFAPIMTPQIVGPLAAH